MLERFAKFVTERGLLADGARVVVGVSGGVDSVVLLHLTHEGGFEPVAAHVNYGLRDDADADEALVRRLCAQWDVPLRVHRATVEGSVQAAAREARYAFFGTVAAEVGAAAIATGHHRDDQAETLLLNLLRGAGPVGLAGMPVRRPLAGESDVEVMRPLLWASRAEIEAYARTHALTWREDPSNQSSSYRRNVLRHQVLPLLEAHFGEGVGERIARTAELMREALDAGAALGPDEVFEEIADGQTLRLDALSRQPAAVQRALLLEALRRWLPAAPRSVVTVREVEALLGAQPGRRVFWPGGTVWRDREHVVFETATAPEAFEAAVKPGETMTPLGTLGVELLETVPDRFDAAPTVEVVDADRLRFPLVLRPWRAGDALRPLGLDGRKKVSDLLTERRVPSHRRSRALVLLSGGEIVWAVGHRLGAVAAVGSGTRRAARLTWTASPEALAEDGGGA